MKKQTMYGSSVFSNAEWIQGPPDCEAPLFRRVFMAPDFTTASIRICGLGFFTLQINGQPVSEDLLVPGWSNYEERQLNKLLYPIRDQFHSRIYYLEYDVTSLLHQGKNVLAIRLGNGWYNNYAYTVEGELAYGFPKLCFQLTLQRPNGQTFTVCSDPETRCNESEILRNNIHTGEVHDLRKRNDNWTRLDYDDSSWPASEVVKAPDSELCLQDFPADHVARFIYPVLLREEAGRRVYDCGENITGYPVLRTPAAEGMTVVVRYSEEYDSLTGALDFSSTGGTERAQEDRCICAGQEYHWHPLFTWHAFRYFEVIGDVPAIVERVDVVHANVEQIASFESSNDTLNWLFDAYLRSQLGNLHCGVPSDCPHRERLGYTGDGQLTCKAAMFCLDMRRFYAKWMRDIVDGQDPTTGHVQHTAPFFGGGGGPGGWGGAIYIVPWQFYLHYGDASLLDQYFPNILLWLDYMESRSENGLVVREEEGGWCLGEWCAPELAIPEPYVNTYYYIKGLETVLRAGRILRKSFDQELLKKRAQNARNAILAAYYNPATGSFCDGANGADAFAVDLEMGDSRTLQNLIERYSGSKILDTGIFGTDLLIDVLFRKGCGTLAYELLTSDTDTSFARMKREGATALWEDWYGNASHNHPMFGGVVRSFFTYLLGIQQKEGSCGYQELVIQPAEVSGLDWVKGSVRLGDSIVSVSVRKDESGKQIVESKVSPITANDTKGSMLI
jgi:alpha-L-rhamnosidase